MSHIEASGTGDGGAGTAGAVAARPAWARVALMGAGHAFVALGIAGAILPLLPSTPFLLLAAACYVRGSERHHRWLMEHPTFGPPLRSWQESRALTLRTKVMAVGLLWASLGVSAWRLSDRPALLAVLGVVGLCSTTFLLLRVRTLRPEEHKG